MVAFFIFVYGLVIGSFLNVVMLRLPNGQRLSGRSACPHCGHVLTPVELLPVVSFVFLRGKCHECKKPISPRYAIIELVCGLLFLTAWLFLKPSNAYEWVLLVKFAATSAVLLVIFVIDLEHYLILDKVLVVSGIIVATILLSLDIVMHPAGIAHSELARGLFAGILGAVPFFLLWWVSEGKWMGFGDVKLMLVLGLIVGWPLIIPTMFLAFFLGTAYAIIPLALGKLKLASKVPFGTFLSLAALIMLYYGKPLLAWYLGILGF